jgi:hypothetical protein
MKTYDTPSAMPLILDAQSDATSIGELMDELEHLSPEEAKKASEADLKLPCSKWEEIYEARCPDMQALSAKARDIARGRDALFHGTRYRGLILATGFLKFVPPEHAIAFTRSPEVAAHFATLPRDDDEGAAAIFVFDRASLKTRYKLECVDNGWKTDPSKFDESWRAEHDEFEEQVFARDVEIAPHLIGLVTAPEVSLTSKARAFRRAAALRLALEAADCSCGMRWRTCTECKLKQLLNAAKQLERRYPGILEWSELPD